MQFRIVLTGTAELLMHNSRLSNPLDPAAKAVKAVSSKKVKTDADHEELARLEHLGSLYYDPEVGPYLPGQNFERALWDAAGITRSRPKVKRGVFIATNVNPLAYDGPRDPEGLWSDENFRLLASVKVQQNRVMRCRPMFRQWRVAAEGALDTSVLSLEELRGIAETAGAMIGIGDYRPRYGRFLAEVVAL